jgi:phage-related protein
MRKVDYVHEERDKPILRERVPKGTRNSFGEDLHRLQLGETPESLSSWRPLTAFGRGVGELKRGPWRLVLSTVVDTEIVWIVCVFRKDAKAGRAMRQEHRRLIESSLTRLASRLPPASSRRH